MNPDCVAALNAAAGWLDAVDRYRMRGQEPPPDVEERWHRAYDELRDHGVTYLQVVEFLSARKAG